MRLFSTSLAILLAALGALPASARQAADGAAAAKAVVAEPLVDLGVVARGETITHSFAIRNDGNAPLVISEVRPGCGCTVAKYDETIAPGATGHVVASVDTVAFTGPIAKSVAVYTNDSAAPRIQLTVKADIQPFVAVDPGYARLFLVRGAKPEAVRQLVWATDGRALEIKETRSPAPWIEVETRRATAEERNAAGPEVQWVVETRLAADAPTGPIAGRVELVTNHPKEPTATVAVSGNVTLPISVSPPRASFGVVEASQVGRTSFLLTNHTGQPIEYSIEAVSPEGVSAELKQIDEQRTQVAVALASGRPLEAFEGTIVVKTSLPSQPRIEIPVDGSVQ